MWPRVDGYTVRLIHAEQRAPLRFTRDPTTGNVDPSPLSFVSLAHPDPPELLRRVGVSLTENVELGVLEERSHICRGLVRAIRR